MFTYKRPNEISSTAGESFLAEGPTNEILDVYVSVGASGWFSDYPVASQLTRRTNKQQIIVLVQ